MIFSFSMLSLVSIGSRLVILWRWLFGSKLWSLQPWVPCFSFPDCGPLIRVLAKKSLHHLYELRRDLLIRVVKLFLDDFLLKLLGRTVAPKGRDSEHKSVDCDTQSPHVERPRLVLRPAFVALFPARDRADLAGGRDSPRIQ